MALQAAIARNHGDDDSQKTVVFSESHRLFVTAPAGYGKTKTMTSKIIYQLASGIVPNPKGVLALTFSVNAARKMRSEVRDALNGLDSNFRPARSEQILIENYHSFARRLLSLYGKEIGLDTRLVRNVTTLDNSEFLDAGQNIRGRQWQVISSFKEIISRHDVDGVSSSLNEYNSAVLSNVTEVGSLTFDSLLTLSIELLNRKPQLRAFIQSCYPSIMVDEAQDTNALGYLLLQQLVGSSSRLCFFGDPLQRVFGFIGALPDLKSRASKDFQLEDAELTENHRFAPGSNMLKLDKVLRVVMNSRGASTPQDVAKLPVFITHSFKDEVEKTCNVVLQKAAEQPKAKIAVLAKQRSGVAQAVAEVFEARDIQFFNGLFRDNDEDYSLMCDACLSMLNDAGTDSRLLTSSSGVSNLLSEMADKVRTQYSYGESYGMLLRALARQVCKECPRMSAEERYAYLADIFETRTLRRSSEYLNVNITLCTIHAAKGLEWDYVVVPGVNRGEFPFKGVCKHCANINNTYTLGFYRPQQPLPWTPEYLDELNVWYVALTRARKDICVISLNENLNVERKYNVGSGKVFLSAPSCFLTLPGIQADTP